MENVARVSMLCFHRKPTKTRKVVEEPDTTVSVDVGEGDFFEDEAETEYAVTNGTGSGSKPGSPRPSSPTEPAAGPSGDQEESIDVDEQGNYILPEGLCLLLIGNLPKNI